MTYSKPTSVTLLQHCNSKTHCTDEMAAVLYKHLIQRTVGAYILQFVMLFFSHQSNENPIADFF